MGDIRSYPPGSHAGIVVLRLTDQSAPAVSEAITELTNWAELEAGASRIVTVRACVCAWLMAGGTRRSTQFLMSLSRTIHWGAAPI